MFKKLFEVSYREQREKSSSWLSIAGQEQWEFPPALTEEMPPGLIGDEI